MRIQAPKSPDDTQSLPSGVRLISLIAGVILLVLGWKSLVPDCRLLYKLTHLDSVYRPIPAKILQMKLRRDTIETGDKYYPDVLFEYFIDGKSVWGWRFSYEEEPRHKSYWEKRLASYHTGDSVTAHVNTDDFKDSFIEEKTDSLLRTLIKALVAGGFVVLGGLLFCIPVLAFLNNLMRGKRA
jgi:hypothetical protein